MIEQINIALEQRGQEFLSLSQLKSRQQANVRKRAYTSIKNDERWTSRVLPHSEQDDIVNSLNYEALQ